MAWSATRPHSGIFPNCDIFTWTPDGGTVAVAQSAPLYDRVNVHVSGKRVVWGEGSSLHPDGRSGYEIYTWTPATGVKQLTKNSLGDQHPRVSGDRVVWHRGNTLPIGIYTWTPSKGVSQLASGLSGRPMVSETGRRGPRLWRAGPVWPGGGTYTRGRRPQARFG